MDKSVVKKFPVLGACGLDCGLCPRYHTEGESRCPGCCGQGFWKKHPSCRFITCCVKYKGIETCALCNGWRECAKIASVLNSKMDSFISYQPVRANFELIQKQGIDEFIRRETGKQSLLKFVLQNYNDGRSKIFYCNACQLLAYDKLERVVKDAERTIPNGADIREKARIIRESISALAESLGIDIKLRK